MTSFVQPPQYQDIEDENLEKLLQTDAPLADVRSVLFTIEINAAVD